MEDRPIVKSSIESKQDDDLPPVILHALLSPPKNLASEHCSTQNEIIAEPAAELESDNAVVLGDVGQDPIATSSSSGRQHYEFEAPIEHWRGHSDFSHTYPNEPFPGWRKEIKVRIY